MSIALRHACCTVPPRTCLLPYVLTHYRTHNDEHLTHVREQTRTAGVYSVRDEGLCSPYGGEQTTQPPVCLLPYLLTYLLTYLLLLAWSERSESAGTLLSERTRSVPRQAAASATTAWLGMGLGLGFGRAPRTPG